MSWDSGTVELTGTLSTPGLALTKWTLVPTAFAHYWATLFNDLGLVSAYSGLDWRDDSDPTFPADGGALFSAPNNLGTVFTLDSLSVVGTTVTANISYPPMWRPRYWVSGSASDTYEPITPGHLFTLILDMDGETVAMGSGADYHNALHGGTFDIAVQAANQNGSMTFAFGAMYPTAHNTTPGSVTPFSAAIVDYAWKLYSRWGEPWKSNPTAPAPAVPPDSHDSYEQTFSTVLGERPDTLKWLGYAWDEKGRRYDVRYPDVGELQVANPGIGAVSDEHGGLYVASYPVGDDDTDSFALTQYAGHESAAARIVTVSGNSQAPSLVYENGTRAMLARAGALGNWTIPDGILWDSAFHMASLALLPSGAGYISAAILPTGAVAQLDWLANIPHLHAPVVTNDSGYPQLYFLRNLSRSAQDGYIDEDGIVVGTISGYIPQLIAVLDDLTDSESYGDFPRRGFQLLSQTAQNVSHVYLTNGVSHCYRSTNYGHDWTRLEPDESGFSEFVPPFDSTFSFVRLCALQHGAFGAIGLQNDTGTVLFRRTANGLRGWSIASEVITLDPAARYPVCGIEQAQLQGNDRLFVFNGAVDEAIVLQMSADGGATWVAN